MLIYVVACVRICVLFKAEWFSIVHIYHILFVHPSVNRHLGCFHFLAIANNAAIKCVYKYLFKFLLWILLGTYPEVELVDHIVIQFLIF